MNDWEPEDYHGDPMVNAVLNVADGIHRLADAVGSLLYGLKYSKENGLSIAEAIEVGAEKIAEAVRDSSR
jgi:hypothetical protein